MQNSSSYPQDPPKFARGDIVRVVGSRGRWRVLSVAPRPGDILLAPFWVVAVVRVSSPRVPVVRVHPESLLVSLDDGTLF
jgi:hypothetical protein